MTSLKKPYHSGNTVWINPARTAVCNDLSDASYKRCANVECNRQFDPDDERQKYCGIKCQRKMSKIRRAKKKG